MYFATKWAAAYLYICDMAEAGSVQPPPHCYSLPGFGGVQGAPSRGGGAEDLLYNWRLVAVMAWSLVPTANSSQLGKVMLENVSHLLFHNVLNLIQKTSL